MHHPNLFNADVDGASLLKSKKLHKLQISNFFSNWKSVCVYFLKHFINGLFDKINILSSKLYLYITEILNLESSDLCEAILGGP